jgi:hypothetical protein
MHESPVREAFRRRLCFNFKRAVWTTERTPMKTTKRLMAALLLATTGLIAAPAAQAHGDGKPKHGGVVQSANDLSFELVAGDSGATLYLEDHDQPLASAGFSGKLSVLQAGAKTETPLTPAGDNKLSAAGVKLAAGAKAVAVLVTPQNQTIAVRFTVR